MENRIAALAAGIITAVTLASVASAASSASADGPAPTEKATVTVSKLHCGKYGHARTHRFTYQVKNTTANPITVGVEVAIVNPLRVVSNSRVDAILQPGDTYAGEDQFRRGSHKYPRNPSLTFRIDQNQPDSPAHQEWSYAFGC